MKGERNTNLHLAVHHLTFFQSDMFGEHTLSGENKMLINNEKNNLKKSRYQHLTTITCSFAVSVL